MADLVKGVTLFHRGEFIDKAESDDTTVYLLARGDGTEVWRQEVRAGGRFCLEPADDWDGLEFFQVQEGHIRWIHGDLSLRLGPGHAVTAFEFKGTEPVNFVAETDVTLIYVCSKPVFHLLSHQVQEMMKLAVAVEERDEYTAGHCRRIRNLSVDVGEALGLSSAQIDRLTFGAFLHDVGKVKIPPQILKKPGKLTPDEWDVMKTHPTLGKEMVAPTFLANAGGIIEQHHERLDGSGYPSGVSGSDVLIEAQIVAAVDTFDAMTTDRPYRNALPVNVALAEIRRESGRAYVLEVVDAFEEVLVKRGESSGGA